MVLSVGELANSRIGIKQVLAAQGHPFQKIDTAGGDVAGSREGASILPLQLQGATARIRGKVLVGPVDLTISERGFTIMMGPNGAGKTTLLRLMHGLQRLSAGALIWNRPKAVVQDRQAFVFQSPVMMRRSVLDNIAYPLVLRGLNKAEARARAQRLARAFGLGDLLERPAPVLSGGEKQKLSLARALIRDPEILFLDEPCANLDGSATREIETILLRAQAGGTRIVMSTHNMGQARRLAQDVVFMYAGKVHECAPAEAFFGQDHKTPEAAGFVNGDIVE
jgi:tungstate transport system ATP-binding protein